MWLATLLQNKLKDIFLDLLMKAEEISAITEEMNASMDEITNLAGLLNKEAERSSSIYQKLQLL